MAGMFDEAFEFNQPLSRWDVSRVTVMSQVFQFARSFNQVEWPYAHSNCCCRFARSHALSLPPGSYCH
jgi:hypothetical protein